MGQNRTFHSWGRLPLADHRSVQDVVWSHDALPDIPDGLQALPYGLGRSYGDSCLNDGGSLLLTRKLDRFIHFDRDRGILSCESGVSLAEILKLIVPHGWFLPVSPGTKFVTVGGAIANDIHGKNHHRAGSFGHHLIDFELVRSDGRRLTCSQTENEDWFRSTIGGLGLTGLVTRATFWLKPVNNAFIATEHIKLRNLDDFWHWAEMSDERYEYTVAWIDCLARGDALGRGIFIRGTTRRQYREIVDCHGPEKTRNLPFNMPGFVLNKFSIGGFNTLFYHKQFRKHVRRLEHYETFFYPLDSILNWNRLYGKEGFYQYQCVVPFEDSREPIHSILDAVAESQQASFLAVLKVFGDIRSWGRLSFPRGGITLCLDFPNNGEDSLALFNRLDEITAQAGGCVYPAKDARMSAGMFREFFPNWEVMQPYLDPKNFIELLAEGGRLKRILILGATSAMAEQVARIYAEEGASLFLAGRNIDKLEAIGNDLASRGAFDVQQAVADLALIPDHKRLVAEAWDALGGVDVALIAYGVLGNQTACETRFETAAELLNINFTSVTSLCTLMANRMINQGSGTLAVISSVAGDRGRQSNYVYGAAKAGLDAFLSGLRNRLYQHGVHVTTIKPGFVSTPMTAHIEQGPLFVSAASAGRSIYKAVEKKRNIAYVPWFWFGIMTIIRNIPEFVFKRLKL